MLKLYRINIITSFFVECYQTSVPAAELNLELLLTSTNYITKVSSTENSLGTSSKLKRAS